MEDVYTKITNYFISKEIKHSPGATAEEYTSFVQSFGTTVSMSKKASPWENSYQESFFNNFKTDLGLEFDR